MKDLKASGNFNKLSLVTKKPFGKYSLLITSFIHEFKTIYRDNRFHRITWLGVINTCSLILLLSWCNSTDSLGLLSYTYLIFFDALCLCICLLSIWIEQKKPTLEYTYGYERFEVLAIFVSSTLICLSSLFTMKKSLGRWIHQTQIHTGRLFPGIIIAFLSHMIVTYSMKNKGLNLVVCASNSSWLQEKVTSFMQNLCHILPGLGGIVLPKMNPFSLLGWAAGGILILAQFFVDIYNYHSADSLSAIFIAFMVGITMYPISAYSGKILLQGTPPHIGDLLEKCLREASTFDGVLEFRNEHFWLLGFDKIVGTLHVRIRRDANEQIVLSQLMNKLSSLVADITIQVFKDEYTWSSSTRQIFSESFVKPPPSTFYYTSSAMAVNTAPSIVDSSKKLPDVNLKDAFHNVYAIDKIQSYTQPQQPAQNYTAIPLPPSLSATHSIDNPKFENFFLDLSKNIKFSPKLSATDFTQHSWPNLNPSALNLNRTDYVNHEFQVNTPVTNNQNLKIL